MDVQLMDGLKDRMPRVMQAWGRRWMAGGRSAWRSSGDSDGDEVVREKGNER